jgi:hypothetical protein
VEGLPGQLEESQEDARVYDASCQPADDGGIIYYYYSRGYALYYSISYPMEMIETCKPSLAGQAI